MVVRGAGGGGGSTYYGHYEMTHPNCRIQDVTCLALFVHLSGLLTYFYFHAFNTSNFVDGEGGGGGGAGCAGSKYYGHYEMTHPNCRLQDVTSLALFVQLSGLFTSFYFHAFNTINFVVG